MKLSPGTRLRSQVDTTEIIVVRPGSIGQRSGVAGAAFHLVKHAQPAHCPVEPGQLAGDAVAEPEQQHGGCDDGGKPGPADDEQAEQDVAAGLGEARGHPGSGGRG